MSVIELQKLTKYYGKSRGIIDLSFTVEEGEVFGFIGPNGAGKSTTIRTMLSLIRPTGGKALLFGKDVTVYGPEVRREIGYLPSEIFYYDRMRVGDLLAYSASFYKKDCARRIREMAKRLDLDLTRRIDDLSLGNKKKVGIIQGLAHQPKLIILDEPTSGLDPLMQQEFFRMIEEENRRGATVFFSSHILSEVQRQCERVAIIKEGKIVSLEKVSSLRENNYKRFKLETARDIEDSPFAIDGVTNLAQDGRTVSFMYRGNLNPLMQRLSTMDLANIWIEEPDLEEIFLHYYEK